MFKRITRNALAFFSLLPLAAAWAGQVTVNWNNPTHNVDGSPVRYLESARIAWGPAPDDLRAYIDVPATPGNRGFDPGDCGYIYIRMSVTDITGAQSAYSNPWIMRDSGGSEWTPECDGDPPTAPVVDYPGPVSLIATAEWREMASILFVVADKTALLTADVEVRDRLVNTLGHTVTYESDNLLVGNESGYDLIFVSASVSSGQIGSKLINNTTPLIMGEAFVLDDMNITGTTSGTDFGSGTPGDEMTIGPDSHPITAGFSGDLVYQTADATRLFGDPVAAAIELAHVPLDTSQSMLFLLKSGDTLNVGTMQSERFVFAGWLYAANNQTNTADNWNADAQTIFDRMVDWALNGDALETGQVLEQDQSQAIASGKTKQIAQSTSLETAETLASEKLREVAAPIQTGTAQPITIAKAKTIAAPSETNSAQSIPNPAGGITNVEEIDAAGSIDSAKARAISAPIEAGAAQPFTATSVDQVNITIEADQAQALGSAKVKAISAVIETESAGVITQFIPTDFIPINQAMFVTPHARSLKSPNASRWVKP